MGPFDRVDVAVQSYKKPELLIYALLTLKKHCADSVDTVYIQDDCSGGGVVGCYTEPGFLELMAPIRIKVKVNRRPCWIHYYEKKMAKKPHNLFWFLLNKLVGRKPILVNRDEVRYQWALDSTDKKYMLIIHDDVMITGDVVSKFLSAMPDGTAIAGELGQCWRCPLSHRCSPELILAGGKPSRNWPITYCADVFKDFKQYKFEKRSCRINEWCCMLHVPVARELSRDSIYFGSYEDLGDIGAYYFDELVKRGYKFSDPLLRCADRDSYYVHEWLGFSGHSVWVDQGKGKSNYSSELVRAKVKEEFGYSFPGLA